MSKLISIFVLALFLLTSCAKEEIVVEQPSEEVVVEQKDIEDNEESLPPSQEVVVENLPERSLTTGLPCTLEQKETRPIAVMYNNNKVSFPQNEISKADVVYECDAEGGMTRLMALFSDWKNLDVIGSVRSARDYFISLSESHGAIFINAGGSPAAYEKLKNSKVDYVDGVNMNFLPQNPFYRDSERIKKCGYEHSMVTTSEKLLNAIDYLNYSTKYDDGFNAPYSFNDEFEAIDGVSAEIISIFHSSYINVDFKYDSKEQKYLKYSFGAPHTDGTNAEQLAFENLIILFVKEKVLDTEGRLDIDLTSGGDGYYVTAGKYKEIKWSRADEDSPFRFESNGQLLSLNPGKTHITLFNKNHKENVTIE